MLTVEQLEEKKQLLIHDYDYGKRKLNMLEGAIILVDQLIEQAKRTDQPTETPTA